MTRKSRAVAKTLSGLCQNLSAGWFGFVFIAPSIAKIDLYTLTLNTVFGIVMILLAITLEYFLSNE